MRKLHNHFYIIKDEILECKFCGKKFKRLHLIKHVRMAHPKEIFEESADRNIYRCSKCDKNFFIERGMIFWYLCTCTQCAQVESNKSEKNITWTYEG